MRHRIHELEIEAQRDESGDLHWAPGFESSPILAVAGLPLRGGVAPEGEIVSAAQCLGWRVVRPCDQTPGPCTLQLCRPEVIDLRPHRR